MCVPLDLSEDSGSAYLMLLLVCRRYILQQSGNLAICVKDIRLSSPHDSTETFTVIHIFSSFAESPPSIPTSYSCRSSVTFSLAGFGCTPRPSVHTRPAAECTAKILSLCVIKQMQFPLNGVAILKARTYMIYS